MKRVALLAVMIAGCGPQTIKVELTPMQEYELASEVLDRETQRLENMKPNFDPSKPDDKAYLDRQEDVIERARQARKAASEKWDAANGNPKWIRPEDRK